MFRDPMLNDVIYRVTFFKKVLYHAIIFIWDTFSLKLNLLPNHSLDLTEVFPDNLLMVGIKENSIQASKISNAPLLSSSVYDRPYKLNKDFLAAIKEKQSSWFPTVYPEYETLTLRELMSRAGGPKTYNSPPPK